MKNDPRALAKQFFREYKVRRLTLEGLRLIISRQGYTVIEFSQIYNTENVASLLKALNLTEYASRSRGFTYADKNYRLVFVNEDLSETEKLIVLSHEESHIFCGHTSPATVGKDVMEKFEANELTHYLMKKSGVREEGFFLRFRTPLIIAAAFITASVLTVGAMGLLGGGKHGGADYSDYYVTQSGEKYHEDGCKHIKNKRYVRRLTYEELENGAYDPCGDCCPDD